MLDRSREFRVDVPPDLMKAAKNISHLMGFPLDAVAQVIAIGAGLNILRRLRDGSMQEWKLDPEQQMLINQIRQDPDLIKLLES